MLFFHVQFQFGMSRSTQVAFQDKDQILILCNNPCVFLGRLRYQSYGWKLPSLGSSCPREKSFIPSQAPSGFCSGRLPECSQLTRMCHLCKQYSIKKGTFFPGLRCSANWKEPQRSASLAPLFYSCILAQLSDFHEATHYREGKHSIEPPCLKSPSITLSNIAIAHNAFTLNI